MKFILLLIIGGLAGCQAPNIAQNLQVEKQPLSTDVALESFIVKLENAIREEDSDQFTKLVNFPLEVRGALDGDRKYISSKYTRQIFTKFLSESSGSKKLDIRVNSVSGVPFIIDNHTKKIDLLEHIKKFKLNGSTIKNSATIGSLVISKEPQGWKIIAIYSDI
jgi:hypothetical protein